MTTAEKIKALRNRAGFTQTELGERLGVKKNAISKWETGRVEDIPAGKIKAMAELFDVRPSYLIDENDGASALTNTESQLVAKFRQLSPEHQDAVMQIVSTMALTDAEKNNAPAGLAEAN